MPSSEPGVRAEQRQRLAGLIAALSAEIRAYPTPIARCDEQLTQLIDERSAALKELQALDQALDAMRRDMRSPVNECNPMVTWINDGGFNAA